jgi:hypothetical protein
MPAVNIDHFCRIVAAQEVKNGTLCGKDTDT